MNQMLLRTGFGLSLIRNHTSDKSIEDYILNL